MPKIAADISWAEMSALDLFKYFWDFQLFIVQGSPITLGKVVIAIFTFIFGYFAAKIASRAFGRRFLRRLSMQSSLRYTMERFSFYAFYILIVLFTLQMLSIPVSIFSFVGGAVALGVGFGSQNVINNFISGLIVMIEQPIRVGDWVEIENVIGQVEQIGARSTRLRSADSKQTIVPNSFFLEKSVLNWTLTDTTAGGSVKVGVAYGSNTEIIKNLLLHIAKSHPDVLPDPAPFVFFQDFGDSSLNFELFYKIALSSTVTVRSVASDLRYKIDEEFRRNQIAIPFPQRQVIFDSETLQRLAGM